MLRIAVAELPLYCQCCCQWQNGTLRLLVLFILKFTGGPATLSVQFIHRPASSVVRLKGAAAAPNLAGVS